MTVREWVELLTKLLLLRLLQLLLYRLVGLTTVLSLSLYGFSFWSITNSSCLGWRKKRPFSVLNITNNFKRTTCELDEQAQIFHGSRQTIFTKVLTKIHA